MYGIKTKMKKNKLNHSFIKKIKSEGKYHDGNGLYLRLQNNSKSWFFRFTFEGKNKWPLTVLKIPFY
jgi:hypothetical protein